ncbi:MAG: polysaccharide deacetylase family protein [Gammaproteobacteria bacterium]|jgi:peptidoglycan/xylan/chitin deacetylase (PgdA/CDA1 family)|nr:polysaccharide deacetylase family protein [Gammaproteobacteria bacterium]
MKKFKIAITVDDLPLYGPTSELYNHRQIALDTISTFEKHEIKGVYGFVNGHHLEKNPQAEIILNEWVLSGHKLGNHTFSHLDLREATVQEFCKDIEANEKILEKYFTDVHCKYFRYPYLLEGETLQKRNAIREYLFDKGYAVAQCTVDYRDFVWNEPLALSVDLQEYALIEKLRTGCVESALYRVDLAQLLSQQLFNRDIPHILLIHIGLSTAMFLNDVLSAFVERGCEFISLEEALSDEVYQVDTPFISTMGRNFIAQNAEIRKLERIPFPPLPVTFEELEDISQQLRRKSFVFQST